MNSTSYGQQVQTFEKLFKKLKNYGKAICRQPVNKRI